MYFKYFKIRFRSVYRTLRALHFLQLLILLSLLLFAVAAYVAEVQAWYSPAVSGLVFYFCHAYRRDKPFIRLFFGEKYFLIHWLEYGILSLPLCLISCCKAYYADVWMMIAIVLLTPFLFRFKIKKIHIDHPFLRKGSYEYQTAFRHNYGLPFLCYLLIFIGLYHKNENLVYVFYVLAGLLFIDAQIREEPLLYTAGFLCVKDVCTMKFKNVLHNSAVLYLPVLIPCIPININLSGRLLFLTLLMILLSCESVLLKYAFRNTFLSGLVVITILMPVFLLSAVYPYLSLLFPLIAVVLFIQMNKRLKHLFSI